jgi:hypothetical protein
MHVNPGPRIMSWRSLLVTGLAVVILAGAGLGAWKLGHRAPAQILTLPNGMMYRFAGVTYGTNHVMGSGWSVAVQKLPAPLSTVLRRMLGGKMKPPTSRTTPKPTLMVWFAPLGTNGGIALPSVSMYGVLADEQGIMAGERRYVSQNWSMAGPPQWLSQQFEVWPRRSRTLECVLFQYNYGQSKPYLELGRFQFRNPAAGPFPEWKPESLPVTRDAGDLKITLHDFLAGVNSGGSVKERDGGRYYGYKAVKPGEEALAAVRFTVDSPRGTNESWTVAQFHLSDPTGNDRKATSWSSSVGRPAHFSPVLWPDEPAWKFAARFKRQSGFPESDLVVFRDVPLPELGQTNTVDLTNTVNKIECILKSVVLRAPMTNSSYSSRDLTSITLEHSELPDDFAVDLVSVTFADPAAVVKSNGSSYGGTSHEAHFTAFPTNQTHATITYAVQKTRQVEFLVPPNWVRSTNEVEIKVEAD